MLPIGLFPFSILLCKNLTPTHPLPVAGAIRITLQICDALGYCHEHGIIHCEIKPENVMMQEDGNITIIDFGIALLEGARRVTWRGL
jgi:eukaryotic-like serine/threonine-protein kinase